MPAGSSARVGKTLAKRGDHDEREAVEYRAVVAWGEGAGKSAPWSCCSATRHSQRAAGEGGNAASPCPAPKRLDTQRLGPNFRQIVQWPSPCCKPTRKAAKSPSALPPRTATSGSRFVRFASFGMVLQKSPALFRGPGRAIQRRRTTVAKAGAICHRLRRCCCR